MFSSNWSSASSPCLKAAQIVDLLHPLGESAQVAPPTIRDTRDDELLARGDLKREGAGQGAHHHGGEAVVRL